MKSVNKMGGVPTTDEVLRKTAEHPLHLRHKDDLKLSAVSSTSLWISDKWFFDNPTPSATRAQSTFSWNLKLLDGSNLLDSQHADMLDWLRRLVWSAYSAPGDGAVILKPGSLATIAAGLRYLTIWLVDHHIEFPSEITTTVIDSYIRDLRDAADDQPDKPDLTEGVAYNRLAPFSLLWRQRFALAKAGIDPMPSPPFERGSVIGVAKEIAAVASGSYRPLPDEVAIPILNVSMSMIGTPADDVIALLDACSKAYASAWTSQGKVSDAIARKQKQQTQAAVAFRFSDVDGSPWHFPLDPNYFGTEVSVTEKQLVAYLELRRAEWNKREVSSGHVLVNSRQPTLPVEIVRGLKYVDYCKLTQDLGLPLKYQHLLLMNTSLKTLINKAALEQGLCPARSVSPMQRVRQLVRAVRAAGQMVIQGTTGMRNSELCGLRAGIDPTTGLPISVKVRNCLDGLGEVFILTTELSKTEETPRDEEWTLGYRPKGSREIPPAVQAITLLDTLLAPFRQMIDTDNLFVTLMGRRSLPKSVVSVGHFSGLALLHSAKDFIEEWVDLSSLPDEAKRKTMDKELVPYRESRGRNFQAHQWRKTFAHFATMVDGRLLPILQMHYHHVSIAMTDSAYTKNTFLMRDISDVRYQQMAMLAKDIADGDTAIDGRFGDHLREKITSELGPQIQGLSSEEAYAKAYIYVGEADLDRLFFEPHGICGARSVSQMACHAENEDAEVLRWSNRLTPNYETRTPTLCSGCQSFALAKWHLPFWEQRYIDHVIEVGSLQALGLNGPDFDNSSKLTSARARQARSICSKLGADLNSLDQRAADEMKALNYAT